MDSVVHFEMPADDNERVSAFYSNVFGWQMNQMGKEMNEYLVAYTTPTDPETRMVKQPGAINGGFFKKEDKEGFREPHLVISVENLEASMKKVTKEGGKLSGEPSDIPGIGKYVSFYDTEGNLVGMLQAFNK